MRRLREHNVIHFDLRLANFIVSITRPLRVAVIDFALSRIRDEDELHGMRLILHPGTGSAKGGIWK